MTTSARPSSMEKAAFLMVCLLPLAIALEGIPLVGELDCMEANPCGSNAICSNFMGYIQCSCPIGTTGDPYLHECYPIPEDDIALDASFNCSSQHVEARVSESYARSVVPFGDVDLVFLDYDSEAIQPGCPSRYEEGAYVAESYYGLCAAERYEEDGEIVEKYKILVSSLPHGEFQLISHNFERVVIDFECRFLAESTLTLGGPLVPVLSLMHIDIGSQHAEFTLKMARYTSLDFNAISTDNNILQGSAIYIALTLEGATGLAVQATTCTVSAYENEMGPILPLIIEGCPAFGIDNVGVQIHPQNTSDIFAFSFDAFMWNPIADEEQNLWISCTATVCTEESGSCLHPCRFFPIPFKRRRSALSDKKSESSGTLSLGPFNFKPTCNKQSLGCSHHCHLNDLGEEVCACPPGSSLLDDGMTCYKNLLLQDNTLLFTVLILFFVFMLLAGTAYLISLKGDISGSTEK